MTATPLRCDGKLHGEYDPERGTVRVKCNSRWCGYKRGIVVYHEFNLVSGKVTTHRYKDTPALAGAKGKAPHYG